MSKTYTLSREELIEITGRKQKKAQIQLLAKQGIDFLTNADGYPIVLRTVVEAKLGIFSKLSHKSEPTLFNKGV